MKNNTKVRLKVSKTLLESIVKELVAESKSNMSGGAYTETVKQPKAKMEGAKPKAEKEESKPPMKKKMHKEGTINENEAQALQDLITFLQDNAGYLAAAGGITGAAKWIASKVMSDPKAKQALDAASGAGSVKKNF